MTEEQLASFRETIMNNRAERKFTLGEIQTKEKIQVVLDFRFLKDFMEKGGMMVAKDKLRELWSINAIFRERATQ